MEQKQRIEVTEKIKIVRAHLAREIGVREAARVVGVTDATIRSWIRLYKTEGLEGFIRQTNRVYSVSEKRAAVEDYLRGGISNLFFQSIQSIQSAWRPLAQHDAIIILKISIKRLFNDRDLIEQISIPAAGECVESPAAGFFCGSMQNRGGVVV